VQAQIEYQKRCIVANLDIGGGTTNISVFKNGEIIDVSCLDIGGQLIKIGNNLEVIYIAPKIKKLADYCSIEIKEDRIVDIETLKQIAAEMTKILAMAINICPKDDIFNYMVTNHTIRADYKIDVVTISGGVADFFYTPAKNIFRYSDVGGVLAEEIRDAVLFKNVKVIAPYETIRATVIGAGSHTTNLSGSTIFYNKSFFPLKNIPILKLDDEEQKLSIISMKIKEKLNWFRVNGELQQVAVAFKSVKDSSFSSIKKLANEIIKGISEILSRGLLIFIIVEEDIAKVLGQTIFTELEFKYDVLCIDSVSVDTGDYIDVGKPIAVGNVVPVVIKTLVFEK